MFKSMALFIALMLPSAFTYAGSLVKYAEESTLDAYVDLSSVSVSGGVARYKSVINGHRKLGKAMSVVAIHEMRCREKTIRFIESLSFSDSFGRGAVVGGIDSSMLGDDGAAFFAVDGEYGSRLHKIVCGKK